MWGIVEGNVGVFDGEVTDINVGGMVILGLISISLLMYFMHDLESTKLCQHQHWLDN